MPLYWRHMDSPIGLVVIQPKSLVGMSGCNGSLNALITLGGESGHGKLVLPMSLLTLGVACIDDVRRSTHFFQ